MERQAECKGGYRRRKLDGEASVVAKKGRPALPAKRKPSKEKADGEDLERGRVYGKRSKERWEQVRRSKEENKQAESVEARRRYCVAGAEAGKGKADGRRSDGTRTEETDTVREVCAVGLISRREVAKEVTKDSQQSDGVRWRKGGKAWNEREVKAQEMVLGRRLGVVKSEGEEQGMEELQKRRVGTALGGMVLKRKSKRRGLEARKV